MFKTKTLIDWVENLMLMVGEAYEVLDTDRAYFEAVRNRLEALDKIMEKFDKIRDK